MRRRGKAGFTLIEVLCAFGIALLMIGPIASIISGVAGSFAGLERSSQRRADLQAAGAVAMTTSPLRPGTVTNGDYTVQMSPVDLGDGSDLRRAGWQLYSVRVAKSSGARNIVLETVRIGRL
jgi:type II secretory pathway pseudopilin PulG